MGSILSEGEESPSPELIQLYQKFGFKVFSFPAPSHVVTATFPYTTTLSIWLAARRVHPALDAYIKVRHRPDVCVGGWGAASTLGGSRGGWTAQAGRERWFWEGSTLGPSRRRCLWSWVDGQRLLASLPHDLAGTGVPASSMGACSETPPGEFSSGWDQRQPWCSAPTPALNGQADPPRPRPRQAPRGWQGPGAHVSPLVLSPQGSRTCFLSPGLGRRRQARLLQFPVWSPATPAGRSVWGKQERPPAGDPMASPSTEVFYNFPYNFPCCTSLLF